MDLPVVSVVFITHNRAHTLVATVESLIARVDYPRDRLELLISDDASRPDQLAIARSLPVDRVLTTRRNAGLGANGNKALAQASGEFILQLQDDWLFVGDPDFLRRSIAVLQDNGDIAMVTYRPRAELRVDETRPGPGYSVDLLVARKGPDEKGVGVGDLPYTDNPHLKRRDFHRLVGPYAEGVPMTVMELEMARAVARRPDMRIAVLNGPTVFHHIGAEFSQNPGEKRERLRQAIIRIPGGAWLIEWSRRFRQR